MGKKRTVELAEEVHRRAKIGAISQGETLKEFVEKSIEQRLMKTVEGVTVGRRREVEVGWPSRGMKAGPTAVEEGLARESERLAVGKVMVTGVPRERAGSVVDEVIRGQNLALSGPTTRLANLEGIEGPEGSGVGGAASVEPRREVQTLFKTAKQFTEDVEREQAMARENLNKNAGSGDGVAPRPEGDGQGAHRGEGLGDGYDF